MRCYDTGKEQAYLHHLMAAVDAKEAQDLARFANTTASPDFAQFFPSVVLLADEGDETARKILRHAGEELAYLAEAVLDRLFHAGQSVMIAASGGVFRNSTLVFECFRDAVQSARPGSFAVICDTEPAAGALMMARERA
jgi:N-acetylglucosamine kinase-like BadF-type ATPase